MDHHQREQRRAAAEAFNQSLEQLAACFQTEDLSATDFLPVATPDAEGESQQGQTRQGQTQKDEDQKGENPRDES